MCMCVYMSALGDKEPSTCISTYMHRPRGLGLSAGARGQGAEHQQRLRGREASRVTNILLAVYTYMYTHTHA